VQYVLYNTDCHTLQNEVMKFSVIKHITIVLIYLIEHKIIVLL